MTVRMRQYVERQVIAAFVKSALDAGCLITVNDGEANVLKKSNSIKLIMAALMTTDEDILIVYTKGKASTSWVKLIYGNEGPDVINDYTTDLEPLMKRADAVADYWDKDGPWAEFKEAV